jgi:hypothetical protein
MEGLVKAVGLGCVSRRPVLVRVGKHGGAILQRDIWDWSAEELTCLGQRTTLVVEPLEPDSWLQAVIRLKTC